MQVEVKYNIDFLMGDMSISFTIGRSGRESTGAAAQYHVLKRAWSFEGEDRSSLIFAVITHPRQEEAIRSRVTLCRRGNLLLLESDYCFEGYRRQLHGPAAN